MTLKDKVAIVTGAGQGIGLEISKRLASAGAKLILNDIGQTLANNAASAILNKDGVCIPVVGDSGDLKIVQQLVESAIFNFGRLDIVIANAGITLFGDFFTYTPEDFFRVMQINLGGTFFLAQAAAKQMRQQTEGGCLLFMSSAT